MAKVIALTNGYVGLIYREAGSVFEWPDDTPIGKWVKPAGDAAPADEVEELEGDKALDAMNVKQLIAYASDHGIDLGDAKRKADILSAIRSAPSTPIEPAAPFADAPEPQAVEINRLTGATQPDWVAPPQE